MRIDSKMERTYNYEDDQGQVCGFLERKTDRHGTYCKEQV